jgi:hypothetical protein
MAETPLMRGIGPFRRFVRRLSYRDAVLEHLDALLLSYPSGRQFTKDFPGLRAAIRSHFEAGVAPASSAVQLAAKIVAAFVRQLDGDARAEVLARLSTVEHGELEALAAKRIAKRQRPPAEASAFAAQLSGVALVMARRMTETGTLRPEELDHLLRAIEEALAGGRPEADTEAGKARPLAAVFAPPDRAS